ncbi:MAG: hypothetical protein Q9165_002104 [Trypethelium subeluteriae]
MSFQKLVFGALAGTAAATVLWDGRFNGISSSTALNTWSFSNEVGPYQYYIHGNGPVTEYVDLATSYKNPADTSSSQGIQITLDNTAVWNSDNMIRTELIPQTTAAINKGTVYYHFSLSHNGTNAPSPNFEHQVGFFESHFTEMKFGLLSGEQGATSDNSLRWMVNSQTQWNTTFTAGVWHNIAYGIDFDAGSVTFYHSTGSDPLTKTAGPVSVSASSNGADWHVGVLGLNQTSAITTENWLWSGVYIESGSLTTSVAGPASAGASSSAAASSVAATSKAVAAPATSSAPASSVVAPAPTTLATSVVAPSAPAAASPSAAAPASGELSASTIQELYNWISSLLSQLEALEKGTGSSSADAGDDSDCDEE